MNTQRFRNAFALPALITVGLLGNLALASAQSIVLQHPVGSWLYTVTIPVDDNPADNIVFQGVETYMLGGGYIETDQLSFSPTLGLSTPAHGSWASTGGSNFLMTYLNFTFDNTGTAQGKTLVRQTATIGADRKSYTGSGDFTYLDPNGEVVLAGTFTVTATRIEVQAPAASTPTPQLAQGLENLRRLRGQKRSLPNPERP
jgi:hypothetical protein